MSTRAIGSIIHPSWSYDLEASLRLHCFLVQRALKPEWRFRTDWVWTGPFETLMGHPGCGSSFEGHTSWAEFALPIGRDPYKAATAKLNSTIIKCLCAYPKLASLDEEIPYPKFRHMGDACNRFRVYERARTRRPLNSCHKRARTVENVRLACTDRGVGLLADVTLTGSRWALWWLADQDAPLWGKQRLDTWLSRAIERLDALVKPRKESP